MITSLCALMAGSLVVLLAGAIFCIAQSRRMKRKLAELDHQLLRYRNINDHPSDVTWRVDSEFRFTYVSPADEIARGFRPDEVIGTTIWAALKPEGIEHINQVNANVDSHEQQGFKTEVIRYEVELLRKDGTFTWAEISVFPLHDEQGNLVGYQGVNRDINDRKRIEAVLRESEERYRRLVETAQEGILVARDGVLAYYNPMLSSYTGYFPEELDGMPFLKLVHPDDHALVLANHKKRLAGEPVGNRYEMRVVCKNGDVRWMELSAVKIDWNGRPATLCFITDISDRKHIETVLRASEERYRCLVETAQEGILVAQDGVLAYFNPMLATILKYPIPELENRPFLDVVYPEDREMVMNNYKRRLAGEILANRYHVRLMRKSGMAVWVEMSGVRIEWNGRPATLAFVSDISERLEIEKKVRYMAQHDPLTDLPNRALFSDRLQHAIRLAHRENRRLAVMFVDLDQFKPVNDNIGHEIGDQLLQAVAHRIHSALRESDTVARMGGDEFVVLIPSVRDGGDAEMVANRIRTAMLAPFQIGEHTIPISASTGIAMFPDHGETEVELCRNADKAMYQVKNRGRDGFAIYSPEN